MLENGWKTLTLEKVATLQRGYDLPHRARKPGLVPVVTSSGISDTHAEARAVGPGVVTGRYGTIGEVFFIPENFWPHNTTLFVKDFHGNDPLFIAYLLRTIDFHSHSGKSGVPGINRNDIHALTVRVPQTISEQRAIAEVLSDVDVLVTSLDRLTAKKRNIKQGAMQLLLTGKKRLPGFSGEWETKKLGEIAEISRGRVISHKEINSSIHGYYPVYSSQTSNNGIMGYIDTYDFDGEYITWTTDGVNAGRVFHRNGKFNCTNVCGTIKLKKDYPQFVAIILNTITYKYVSRNLANPKLMNDAASKIKVPLPDLEEQKAIAQILSDMDAEIEALEKRREKYKAIKQGMMQELLTGKTRLI